MSKIQGAKVFPAPLPDAHVRVSLWELPKE